MYLIQKSKRIFLALAAATLLLAPRAAKAATIADVIGWVQGAIGFYNQYLSNQLTLRGATDEIVANIKPPKPPSMHTWTR